MPDIIITPTSGIVDFYPVASGTRVGRIDGSGNSFVITNPSGYIFASGSGLSINTSNPNALVHAYSSTSGARLFNAEGTNGSLFSIIDNLSGSLMSVNNSAGLPVLEVFSDDSIIAGRYNQNDLVVSSGGNIGMGTSSPSGKLDVRGNIYVSGNLGIGVTAPSGRLHIDGGDAYLDTSNKLYLVASGYSKTMNYIWSASNGNLQVIGGGPALILSSQGGYIDLGGNASTYINIGQAYDAGTNNQPIKFSPAGTERIRITPSGNLGIGTTAPAAQLHVIGSGIFTQNITASGFIKNGGTSGQFLKADGSTDSSSYQPLLTNPVTGTGIINHIAYWNSSSGIVADSGQLYWDSTNNRLGIGTTTPSGTLHVYGNINDNSNPIQIIESSGLQTPIVFRTSNNDRSFVTTNDIGSLKLGGSNSTSISHYSPTVGAATVLLHLNGANNSTTFTDSSINNFSITNYSGIISTTQSKFGGSSAYFNGSSRIVLDTSGLMNFGTDDFTVELWFYFDSADNNSEHSLITQADPNDYVGIYIGINAQDLMWLAGNDTGLAFQRFPSNGDFAAGSINTNAWNHVAMTRNNGTFRLFANGKLVDTYKSDIFLPDSNRLLTIGGRTLGSQYFTGYIDEVRVVKGMSIYNGEFTVTSSAFTTTATASSAAASVLLHFDGSAADSSINAFSISFSGSVETNVSANKFGGYGAAIYGTDGFITCPSGASVFGTQDFTIEAWIRPNAPPFPDLNTYMPWIYSSSTDGFTSIINDNGTISFGRYGTAYDGSTSNAVFFDQWNHIAITRQNQILYMFINGVLGYQQPNTTSFVLGDVLLGSDTASSLGFVGYIDEFKITRGVALYNSNFTPPKVAPSTTSWQAEQQGLIVDNLNRVGIGTNSPNRKYHQNGGKLLINSSDGSWGQLQIINPTNNESTVVFAADAIASNDGTITSSSNSLIWAFGLGPYGNTTDKFIIGNNTINNSAFTITDNGNIGIGTTSPAYKLDINGTLRYGAGGNGYIIGGDDTLGGELGFYTSAEEALAVKYISDGSFRYGGGNLSTANLVISSVGNVGMGTTSPVGKLHVSDGVNDLFKIPISGGMVVGNEVGGYVTSSAVHKSQIVVANGASCTPLVLIGGDAGMQLWKDSSASAACYFGMAPAGSGATDNFYINMYKTSWNTRFFINNTDGNVGIGTTSPTAKLHIIGSGIFSSGINIANQTASTIASFDSSKNIVSLNTTTYPSLTELSYVKGVTSSIQTQLNSKQNTLTNPVTGTGITNHIPYWNSSSGITVSSGQLYWDSSNNRLGIGTTTPSGRLHIIGSGIFSSGIKVGDSSTNGYVYGPSGDASVQFNAGASNRLDLNGGSVYLNGTFNYFNGTNYCNGTLYFPKTSTPTSTATQSNPNELRFFNGLWNGSSAYDGYNTIHSIASTSVSGASRLAFLINNGDGTQGRTERLSVTSSGYVGINTTTPSGQLHVVGTGLIDGRLSVGTPSSLTTPSGALDVAGTIFVRGSGNNISRINLKSSTYADNLLNIRTDTNGNLYVDGGGGSLKLGSQDGQVSLNGYSTNINIGHSYNANTDAMHIRLTPANTELMRLTCSGTVGIGLPTTSNLFNQQPYANTRVHIAGSGADSGSAALIVTNSGISPLLYVRNDGNIGIGTTTPSGQLHIIGSGIFSSGISTSTLDISSKYTEKVTALSIVSSGLTITLNSGNLFTCNLNSNISTITISGVPTTSGVAIGFSLIFTADGTARTVTWPSGIKWAGGTAPTLTSTNAKRDFLSFISTNNGTDYLGFVGGQNY